MAKSLLFSAVTPTTAESAEDHQSIRLELGRARTWCRAWSETIHETRRKNEAAAFVRHALEAFAREMAPQARLGAFDGWPHARLDQAAERLAESIGCVGARLPVVEGLHLVTSLYPALLPERERSTLGAYYTPFALCARLFDQAREAGVDWLSANVLDPAAGGGAFLMHAALRMREAMKDCAPAFVLAQIGRRLLGLELDPLAAGLARRRSEVLLAEFGSDAPRDGRFPPWCALATPSTNLPTKFRPRHWQPALWARHPDRRTREPAAHARSLYGHANLYGVFTDIALRWAKPAAWWPI